MSTCSVSIIIPVYNVAPYLAECLDSALNQNTDAHIQVIAINDGSTDESQAILDDYEHRYANLSVRAIRNQGQSVARNIGLALSSAEYVLFLDGDDYLEIDAVSCCIAALNNSKADIVFFSASVFCDGVPDEFANTFSYDRPPLPQNATLSGREFFSASMRAKRYTSSPCLYMSRRAALGDIEFYPGIVHEDNLFTTSLLVKNENTLVACVANRLYRRRLRPQSVMTRKKSERNVDGYLTVARELLSLARCSSVSSVSKEVRHFAQSMLVHAARSHSEAYNGRFSPSFRSSILRPLTGIPLANIKIKHLLLLLIPEILSVASMFQRKRKGMQLGRHI